MSIKIENTEVLGWEAAIRGMRNPMNSWNKSDSLFIPRQFCDEDDTWALAEVCGSIAPVIKENDHTLMMNLAHGGPVHAKYRRMITVYLDITAPLYWWKEFDTYKVGTVANSCSTMHKIHAKEFTLEDFSMEHLIGFETEGFGEHEIPRVDVSPLNDGSSVYSPYGVMKHITIPMLNDCRERYLDYISRPTKDVEKHRKNSKKYWWQMIQLLPSSYNQKRTVMLSYEVLTNMYDSRKHHKLDEWREFCKWIESLPYSELITGEREEEEPNGDV